MENPSFEEFAEFVREWAGISRKKEILLGSRFEDDLGITGDDGCDLLQATEKRFSVQLHSNEDGFRKTFSLGPNEFLFHSEGWGPDLYDILALFGRTPKTIRDFTVGELYTAVCKVMNEGAAR